MNPINTEFIKEDFDHWDREDLFWRFADSPSYAHAKETCPFLSDKLPEKEKNVLIYIWHSLIEKQEYDAGNTILLATQTGLLCIVSIEKIANYFVSKNVRFDSMIGKKLFGAITRSIGLWSFLSGQKDVGQKLWRSGIEAVKTMKYRKDSEIEKWLDLSVAHSIPIELKMLIDELA